MKLSTHKAFVFAGSCALTAAAWTLFWPAPAKLPPDTASPPAASAREEVRWPAEKMRSLIGNVEKAQDTAGQLEAIRLLSEIPVADVPQALEMVTLVRDHLLTLTAKVLLIRWADSDGEAAAKWAWQRFRKAPQKLGNGYLHDGVWDESFRQIAPAWTYHNPAEFGKWLLARIPDPPAVEIDHPTQEQMDASEQPLSSYEMMERGISCLLRTSPRLAFEAIQKRHAYSSDDRDLANSLETVAQVREGLLAFDHVQDLTPSVYHAEDIYPISLMERWKELDPVDFARSPYHRILEKLNPR